MAYDRAEIGLHQELLRAKQEELQQSNAELEDKAAANPLEAENNWWGLWSPVGVSIAIAWYCASTSSSTELSRRSRRSAASSG